jgi:hypothetical protein
MALKVTVKTEERIKREQKNRPSKGRVSSQGKTSFLVFAYDPVTRLVTQVLRQICI